MPIAVKAAAGRVVAVAVIFYRSLLMRVLTSACSDILIHIGTFLTDNHPVGTDCHVCSRRKN
ncbi:hypothetical protein [Prevotella dentasini]|uniref:hypothetical protein n=1 Tax=Prevotella dentasini TaxID=589537 RepID=UPI0011DE39A7|nr:hypothetical protein [Prevotella dentasini]